MMYAKRNSYNDVLFGGGTSRRAREDVWGTFEGGIMLTPSHP